MQVVGATARGTILLIEDDADIREALGEVLATTGRQVVGVGNGEEALAFLDGNPPPCMILLDLMMPVMNGYEFRARQLTHQALTRIPVVLLSAHQEVRAEADAMNVAGFVAKPVDLPRLMALVDRHCP